MFYIVYVSESNRPMSEADLADILRVSRQKNTAAGISGMLIYKYSLRYGNGSFLQLLEGEEAAVRATFARILADKRHHTKIVLEEGEAPDRQFPDWSMGFKNVTPAGIAALPGFADIGEEAFDSPAFRNRVQSAVDLLKFFYTSD
jgi:hypothetical protein